MRYEQNAGKEREEEKRDFFLLNFHTAKKGKRRKLMNKQLASLLDGTIFMREIPRLSCSEKE